MLAYQDRRRPVGRPSVEVAFTDRFGGGSTGPYAELNLSVPPADVPGAAEEATRVRANLDLAARALAGDGPLRGLTVMRQVHGTDVAVVGAPPGPSPGPVLEVPAVDALVTTTPGWVLVVRAADCVPVLLADPAAGVVAAAHAGRAGLAGGVLARTLDRMRELGARQVSAWAGPRVCGSCYEVPDALRADVTRTVPQAWAQTSWGTPALDIGAGVLAQLRAEGVDVVDVDRCTVEDEDLFSYRRQGAASGRHGGLIWMRP